MSQSLPSLISPHRSVRCSPCPLRPMRMRVTEEILYIVEIEDRYIRNDGRTADIIGKSRLTSLASARPNNNILLEKMFQHQWGEPPRTPHKCYGIIKVEFSIGYMFR